jgi:hypothetical protein
MISGINKRSNKKLRNILELNKQIQEISIILDNYIKGFKIFWLK